MKLFLLIGICIVLLLQLAMILRKPIKLELQPTFTGNHVTLLE